MEPTPPIDNLGLAEIAEIRAKEVAAKKAKFTKITRILVLSVLVVLAVPVIYFLFIYKKDVLAPSIFQTEQPPQAPPVVVTEEWVVYKSDRTKVYLSHLNTAQTSEGINSIQSVYDPSSKDLLKVNETNIQQGYIFKVTPLDLGLRNLDAIIKIKLESLKLKCPSTASFSDVNAAQVDLIAGKYFDITNCDADYTVTYVPKFGAYYEIIQLYKGDFGYRQKYKATTIEMLRKLKFFPEDIIVSTLPFKKYIDENRKIAFIHPNLDENCCVTPAPPVDRFDYVTTFGNKTTFVDKNNFDGIGVYLVNNVNESFDEFVSNQKQLLVEDYKIVRGTEPTNRIEEEAQVGSYKGIWLKGYSWKGNELVYADISRSGSQWKQFIVFSIKNLSENSFTETAKLIMSSFEQF